MQKIILISVSFIILLSCNLNLGHQLKDTIRDFKKFTSKKIISELQTGIESRKEWILEILFKDAEEEDKKIRIIKFGNQEITK